MQGNYQRRFVAFLDILGFSRLVQQADDPDLRDSIVGAIETMRESLAPNEASDFRVTQFSDCTVLSAALSEYGCSLVMTGSIILATNLLNHGMLLRGGLAVGNMVHTDEVMFGPGFLVAHAQDKSGGTPKIAVDQSLVDEIAGWPNDSGLETLIRTDPYDLSPMLHTLAEFESYDAVPRVGHPVRDDDAARLAELIANECYGRGHPPAVTAKWIWMERYWNDSVRPKGILATTDNVAVRLGRERGD
ncbi:hypothetical protein WG901_13135 [Novosphingobium sp. PS1R-30]|uniref:Guanylate cyclase domain-containing protein n=1 Tax=Novosphingobium anseongense TaxID=3133436 RepID=A0ABU8RXX9_9SPHN